MSLKMRTMLNACIICHKKKIKCDLASRRPCSNCYRAGKECVMYSRKRKRYTNSLSPRESAEPQHNQDDPTQNYSAQIRATQGPKTNDVIETYRGRDRYLGRHVSFDEAIASPSHQDSELGSGSGPRLSPADLELLTHQGAFQLPPKAVQDEYMAAYMKYCNVWTPIVEPEWLHGQSVSYLLLQSILLAASRVSNQPSTHGASADFYRRAKLLFFFGHERNPLISIVSAVLLHWYNPVGPETISTDTSGFWLRTAEAIAFQIGLHKEPAPGSDTIESKKRALRRRLWWTLVVRDCIISAGVGRPRTLNLCDSDVLPPSLDDFDRGEDTTNRLFLVYASICQLLGDIVESCLRPQQQPNQNQKSLENALYRWVKQDFRGTTTLSPGSSSQYTLEARQIMLTYFANLIILDRTPTSDGIPSARSFVASSFISGIYKEFLSRNELCRLGPVFAFYALCAGLALIPGIRFPALRETAIEELRTLMDSLKGLSRQWGSAFGALRALQRLGGEISQIPTRGDPVPVLREEMVPFFEDFEKGLCRQWNVFFGGEDMAVTGMVPQRVLNNLGFETELPSLGHAGTRTGTETGDVLPQSAGETDFGALDLLSGNWEGVGFDWSGSWLLDDVISHIN